MNPEQNIPCPTCRTKIPFDVQQLLSGAQFVCPNCQSMIGLAIESRAKVQETIEKFNDLKENTLKFKKEKSASYKYNRKS